MNVRVYLAGGDPAQVRPLLAEQGHGAEPGPSRSSLEGRGRGAGARYAVDGYEQYQPYTLHVLRTPSLTDLVVSDASRPAEAGL